MVDEGLFRHCPRLLLFCFSRATASALRLPGWLLIVSVE
jgi:hypothetical protein